MRKERSIYPPTLPAEPRIRVLHDEVTIDRFGWLRDRGRPDVHAFLAAENSYAEYVTSHLASLRSEIASEIRERRVNGGSPPPLPVGSFLYFRKPATDLPHPVWHRQPIAGGPAEIVFDPNTIPGSEHFYSLGVFEPSDDGRYIAYSFDIVGNERYELHVRDTIAGRDIWQGVSHVGRVTWAADNQNLYFSIERDDRRHFNRIVRLNLADQKAEVIFEEVNERLAVSVRRSNSGSWLFIDVSPTWGNVLRVQRGATEIWCLPAGEPWSDWRCIFRRNLGHRAYVEHSGDKFLFRLDDEGPSCRIVGAPSSDPSPLRWTEIVPHRAGIRIEEMYILGDYLVLLEREGLRPRLVYRSQAQGVVATVVPDEPSSTLSVGLSAGGAFSAPRQPVHVSKLFYSTGAFLTPDSIFEHGITNNRSVPLYQPTVQGFERSKYSASVVMVDAEDGTQIPISLVMRRDRKNPGPMVLSAYGCYGTSRWPSFFAWPSSMIERLSLLDRGVAFGIVHARGGGEFGRPWHQAAERDRKRTTLTDLISAAEGLIAKGIASRNRIVIEGKSAGGAIVLATSMLRPDLFCGVLAEVPLADIIDTELDFTRPFSFSETAEYGDPHLARDYQYLRSYDPYYNLSSDRLLPPTYIDCALDDGQVLYFQPARYVAQRRFCAPDRDPALVFRTRERGSHFGFSHGPEIAEYAAFRLAWTLDRLGLSTADVSEP